MIQMECIDLIQYLVIVIIDKKHITYDYDYIYYIKKQFIIIQIYAIKKVDGGPSHM